MPVVRDAERISVTDKPAGSAPDFGRTHDWIMLYADGALGDRRCAVVMDLSGDLRGQRVVRERERECREHSWAGSGSRPERLALTAPGGDWRQR